MAEVDPLILELKADVRGFGTELTQAQRIADRRLSAIEASGVRMGQRIGGAFKFAGVAAAGFVASIGVDAVVQAVQSGLEYASSLGEVAQQLGVTTDALQEYRFAASQAGLSTEEIDMALGQLTRRIGEGVNGTKAQADAFKKLGISLKDANGDVIATGEAIPLIAEALKTIESPAEKSAILLDLFGKSGQKLLPLLADGAEGVNGLRDAARDLGIVLSEKQIQDADETADKLSKLKQILAAKIAGAVADNTDSIIALAEALVQLVGSIGTAIKEYNRLREAFGANGQIAIGNILGGPGSQLGGQFIQSGLRRREAQRGQAFRDKFSDIDASSVAKRSTPRSNFAAQGPSGFDLIGNDLRGASASTANGAKGIGGTLTASQQELLAIFVELNAVAADLIDTLEARVEAEKIQIEADKIQAIDRINANDELTAAQKEQARQGIEAIAAGKIELANARLAADAKVRSAEAAQDAADLADIEAQNAVAALEEQYDLADSIAERARIAAQIVETETAAALAAVDAQLLQEDITDAKREQLEAIRRGIVAEGATNKRKAAEGNRGPAGAYLDELNKLNPADQAEKFGVDALKDLNAGLSDAIVNGGNLGDVLEDTGKRFLAQLIELTFQLLVIKPLLESLGGATGGTGGGFGNIFGSLFGRASGGPVSAGQVYRVNEGVGKEFFRPNTGGDIIPLSKMNAAQPSQSQSGGMSVIRLELSGDIDARIQSQSAQVAVEVVRAAEPQLTQKAVSETFRRGQRPSLGR